MRRAEGRLFRLSASGLGERIIGNALIDPGRSARLRLNRQSEPPLPADHGNFVHQQNDYGR